MAHSYLSMTASTALRPILTRAKRAARLPTADNGLSFLGSTTAQRDDQIIFLSNWVQSRLLDRFPVLSISSTTRTTADATFDLPSGMRATDIVLVSWTDSDREIGVVTQPEFLTLSDKEKAFDSTSDRPSQIVLQWSQLSGNGRAEWRPAPLSTSSTKTATIYFRARPTAFTVTDLNSDSVLSVIPDEMIDLYALCLAAEFQKINLGRTHAETVALVQEADDETTRWQYNLAKTLYQRMQEGIGRAKFNTAAANPTPHDFWGLLRNTFLETNS